MSHDKAVFVLGEFKSLATLEILVKILPLIIPSLTTLLLYISYYYYTNKGY